MFHNKLRIEQQKFINKQSNCSARIESFISGVVFRRGISKTPTQFVILLSAISLYVSKKEKMRIHNMHTDCLVKSTPEYFMYMF